MQSLSIARSLRLALIGLTVVLALVAALGLSSLYHARQRYEGTLAQSFSLASAGANLTTASIAEEEVLRYARGPAASRARRRAALAYDRAAQIATSLAHRDGPSTRLVAGQIAAEGAIRELTPASSTAGSAALHRPLARARSLAAALQARQQTRQSAARGQARSDSRRAIILVAVAVVLALLGALALITALVGSMQRPLDALVLATGDLAAGELGRRVTPSGPRELQDLGTAFNAMGEDLADARRRIEDERRRLAVTIESLGDALIVTEPGSTSIATVNPRASELVPELVIGGRADGLGSPLPSLRSALLAETIVEHRGRALAVTAATIGRETQGVVWTLRDTSERARLERAKSDFVATASHELRSPLTSIKGFAELLERAPESMSARQREFVSIILRSTDRLVELVNDLLDVAQIEADRVEIDRRPTDVGEAVREVAEMMGPRIADKRQRLELHLDSAAPPAYADPVRARQIIANLLTNAHLYTGEEGQIQVGVQPARAWVEIVVSDTGVGMTQEEAGRVFERFYRVHDQGHSSPGTGLGLSIVKSLVELHQGQIGVESRPGRGTTFRVRLPAALSAR
ncbi:MAG: ATP-binding protein [Solirubrobacteraceae bacterium]